MRAALATALVLTLATTAAAQTVTGTSYNAPTQARLPSTLRYLEQRIPEVSFVEAPLDQVIDWLNDLTPMQIRPRWQALEEYDIQRDKPITLQLKNLRLSQVLYMIMNEAAGPDVKLAYRASGNLLILSTAEDLGKEMVTRVYAVSDLLVRAPRFTNAPSLDLAGQGGQMGLGTGGGSGQNIFGGSQSGTQDDDEDRGRDQDDDADIEELIQLIIQVVEPDSWADNGGLGTINHFRNLLVVRNNIFVHQALGGYIEEAD